MPLDVHRHLGPMMAKKILSQTKAAERLVLRELEDNVRFTHVAYTEGHEDVSYELNLEYCSCNTVRFFGIPWSHLIRLHQMQGRPFPVQLIDPRWFVEQDPGDPQSDAVTAEGEAADGEEGPWDDHEPAPPEEGVTTPAP